MAGIVIGLIVFLTIYWNTFIWLWQRAAAPDSYYSHAFLIPIISGYLIWRRRSIFSQHRWESSRLGLLLIVSALALHLISVLLDVYFTSGFSIFILAFGLSLYLLGWPITRQFLFPLSFLIFMFPLPTAALSVISIPMKLLAARWGSEIVGWLGIPVVQEGFQLHFSSASLVIGNPCSGLRSLLALMALGSLIAYFFEGAPWKRTLLFVTSIPIAIVSNILRIVMLSLVANSLGSDTATGFFHDFSGMLVFVIALILLLGAVRILEWIRPKPAVE